MPRRLKLRQVEAFKVVMENATVSRGAQVFNISQTAMSKLIANLEADTGLTLFDRHKGRLAPTAQAMRLYDEIVRVFAGVGQVERAIEAIRHEERRQLSVGVMPALSGSFIQSVTTDFLKIHSNVLCSIHSLTSAAVFEMLVSRQIDVGLISPNVNNAYVTVESFMELPMVCIMPHDHPLAARDVVEPPHLDGVDFVSFLPPSSNIHRMLDRLFETYKVRPRIAIVTNVGPTAIEFVAAGFGVSLIHPLFGVGLEHRLTARRFEPGIKQGFQLCYRPDNSNARLVNIFSEQLRDTAAQVSGALVASGLAGS